MLPHRQYTRHQSHLFAVKWHGLCIWHKSVLFLWNKMDLLCCPIHSILEFTWICSHFSFFITSNYFAKNQKFSNHINFSTDNTHSTSYFEQPKCQKNFFQYFCTCLIFIKIELQLSQLLRDLETFCKTENVGF